MPKSWDGPGSKSKAMRGESFFVHITTEKAAPSLYGRHLETRKITRNN